MIISCKNQNIKSRSFENHLIFMLKFIGFLFFESLNFDKKITDQFKQFFKFDLKNFSE